MSYTYCIRRRKKGTHLTFEDREELEAIVRQNERSPKSARLGVRQIAKRMGVSPATISRELKRGAVVLRDYEYREYESYSALIAQRDYQQQASAKGPRMKIGSDYALVDRIEELILNKHHSPYAVTRVLKKEGLFEKTSFTPRTLYNYIHAEIFPNVTMRELPRKGNCAKKKKKKLTRRIRDVNAKRIDERPQGAMDRSELGHWEMDCIESCKKSRTCLLVLVERKTRKTLVFKLRSQKQKEVIAVLNRLEKRLGAKRFAATFLSITVDNGSEFLDWRGMERSCIRAGKVRTHIYFCHPYHSWERGTNEQMNGQLRRFIPKGCDISNYSVHELKEIENWLNNYPRKILEGSCSNDQFPLELLQFL